MVLRQILIVSAALLLAMAFACSRKTDHREAEQLAEMALADYCIKEGLRRTDFGGASISPEEKYDWSAEYQSSTQPKHVLILYVKNGKIVERHRLVE